MDTPATIFYNCSVCSKPSQLVACSVCQEFSCVDCSSWYANIPEHLKGHRERTKTYCLRCDENLELDIIEKTEDKDLPLLVNINWMTKKAGDKYKERLKEASK